MASRLKTPAGRRRLAADPPAGHRPVAPATGTGCCSKRLRRPLMAQETPLTARSAGPADPAAAPVAAAAPAAAPAAAAVRQTPPTAKESQGCSARRAQTPQACSPGDTTWGSTVRCMRASAREFRQTRLQRLGEVSPATGRTAPTGRTAAAPVAAAPSCPRRRPRQTLTPRSSAPADNACVHGELT